MLLSVCSLQAHTASAAADADSVKATGIWTQSAASGGTFLFGAGSPSNISTNKKLEVYVFNLHMSVSQNSDPLQLTGSCFSLTPLKRAPQCRHPRFLKKCSGFSLKILLHGPPFQPGVEVSSE